MDFLLKIRGRVRDAWDNDKVEPMVAALFSEYAKSDHPWTWEVGFNWLHIGFTEWVASWKFLVEFIPDGSYENEVNTSHLDSSPEENALFHAGCCLLLEKVLAPLSDRFEVKDGTGFWEKKDFEKLVASFTDLHREAQEADMADDEDFLI